MAVPADASTALLAQQLLALLSGGCADASLTAPGPLGGSEPVDDDAYVPEPVLPDDCLPRAASGVGPDARGDVLASYSPPRSHAAPLPVNFARRRMPPPPRLPPPSPTQSRRPPDPPAPGETKPPPPPGLPPQLQAALQLLQQLQQTGLPAASMSTLPPGNGAQPTPPSVAGGPPERVQSTERPRVRYRKRPADETGGDRSRRRGNPDAGTPEHEALVAQVKRAQARVPDWNAKFAQLTQGGGRDPKLYSCAFLRSALCDIDPDFIRAGTGPMNEPAPRIQVPSAARLPRNLPGQPLSPPVSVPPAAQQSRARRPPPPPGAPPVLNSPLLGMLLPQGAPLVQPPVHAAPPVPPAPPIDFAALLSLSHSTALGSAVPSAQVLPSTPASRRPAALPLQQLPPSRTSPPFGRR
eukprot:TRINITY_DN26887_c0_g1_i1.p1 TRINITY_DN26887_c0_g1~~TRINITY_DN26887_c0_g1_i1.p1  ORF type:complete len:410 (+),score=41.44 TRINITY_DN26887_c0_g1_i1:54-1283(+)